MLCHVAFSSEFVVDLLVLGFLIDDLSGEAAADQHLLVLIEVGVRVVADR